MNFIFQRSKHYKAVRGDLPDPDVLKVEEVYKDFTADIAPLITTMAISSDVPLVDSAYGPVQEGSPISYQHPVPLSRVVVRHQDTPAPPALPLDGYRLDPTTCNFVCSHQQQNQLMALAITLDMARKVEVATREQCGVAPCQKAKAHIFQVPGGVPCERPQFCRESGREDP